MLRSVIATIISQYDNYEVGKESFFSRMLTDYYFLHILYSLPRYGAFDLGLAVSVPLPIVTGIFVLLWFQSRLT